MKKYLVVFLLLMLTSCSSNEKKPQDPSEKEQKVEKVQVVIPVLRKHVLAREYNGVFKPFREANVGSSLPGKVEKIYVKEGEQVEKGALLAQLSSELLMQAEIEYQTLKKDFQRVSYLLEKNSISQQDFDHVKAKYEAAQAKYEMIKKNTEIRAPFSGTVVKYLVKEGENYFFTLSMDPAFSMNSGIIQMMQLDPLLCVVEVGEKDYSSIRLGQKVEVEPFAFPGKKIEGKIYRVEPVVSSIDKLVRVLIEVPNHLRLLPGMGAKVTIPLGEKALVALPRDVLYMDPLTNNSYVYVLENNKAVRTPVGIAAIVKDSILLDGFSLDKKVIYSKVSQLQDGQLVEAIEN